jgi:hypothetical protein
VLVHGAWADGSSWNDIIAPLQAKGLNVMAAPIPLTSLSDDVAALDRALERTDGPIVLAAHAYAGAVIGKHQRASPVARLHSGLGAGRRRDSRRPEAPQLVPDEHGFIWMPKEAFGAAFSQHTSPRTGRTFCGDAAAHRRRVHQGEGSTASVEDKAVLVPRC